jgi:predicted DNA-binding transcriptional regulator AlpA
MKRTMEQRAVSLEAGEPEDILWRMENVMRFLNCSRSQVWRYIRQGLPCFKVGDHTSPLYFSPQRVRQWIELRARDVTRL